jgi:hypothetical protein
MALHCTVADFALILSIVALHCTVSALALVLLYDGTALHHTTPQHYCTALSLILFYYGTALHCC